MALSRMAQDRGKPIRSFAARLRGQAEVCMFTLKCPGCARINNQGEQRVADQLCIGLADPEIQEDLLKDPNQAMSVEETIRFVEVRAANKRSVVTITTPTSTNVIDEETDQGEAINSGYRKQQRFRTPRPPAKATTPNRNQPTHNKGQANTPKQPTNAKATNADAKVTCSFCGRQGHGERARTAIRRLQCPAFGSTCSACSKPNHYASLCWQNSERESAIRESVADMTEGTLPHQTWDSSTGSWVKRRSPPQPNLDVPARRLQNPRAYPPQREAKPGHHRPCRHRMPELPGRTSPTEGTRPGNSGPHPGLPLYELRQWTPPTHTQGCTDQARTQELREIHTTDDIL